MMLSLVTGALLLIVALCCVIRHGWASPQSERFQSAPQWYRAVLFFFTVVSLYIGGRFVLAGLDGVDVVPPDASTAVFVFAFATAVYKVGSLIYAYERSRIENRVAQLMSEEQNQPSLIYKPGLRRL